jgi:type VI secretion system protein ImpH
MATPGRRTDRPLVDLLFDRGYQFEFFQAVRLLARLYMDRLPVGEGAAPQKEIVRFRAHASMAFPASAIHNLGRTRDGQPSMTVAFMGLTGPQGILPAQYTEMVVNQDYSGDGALADFFDIFNHRLISVFYRAWEKHHFPAGFERESRGEIGADRFARQVFALIGMGTAHLSEALPFPSQNLLRYAGLLAQRPHSASALRGMLADYFQLPVEVDQLLGKWYPLEPESLSYMEFEGVHNQLGFGAIAGDAIWNQQALFRVRIGPVGIDRFIDFLPTGKAFREAVELTRFFVGDTLEFELQIVLAAAEVPLCRLTDEVRDAPRLGWLGWLKTSEFQHDAKDALFEGVRMM